MFPGLSFRALYLIVQGFFFALPKGDEAALPLLGGGELSAGSEAVQDHLMLKTEENMSLKNFLESGANVSFTITAMDLKEFLFEVAEEQAQTKSTVPAQPEKYLTAQETAEKLGVDVSTLWRWDKTGYLKKIKVGRKIQYRESDVLKLMEG